MTRYPTADSGREEESLRPLVEHVREADLSAVNLGLIQLYPLDLGYEKLRSQRGWPALANKEQATSIFERLAELSEPYGATLAVEAGHATVKVRRIAILDSRRRLRRYAICDGHRVSRELLSRTRAWVKIPSPDIYRD